MAIEETENGREKEEVWVAREETDGGRLVGGIRDREEGGVGLRGVAWGGVGVVFGGCGIQFQ